MTGARKYQRLALASIVRRAAEEALERRFGARHQPRPRWGRAKVMRKKKAAPPAPAPRRLRACGVCGELGHRADSARHKTSAFAPVTEICRHGIDANCRRCLKDSAAASGGNSAEGVANPSVADLGQTTEPKVSAAAETIDPPPAETPAPPAPPVATKVEPPIQAPAARVRAARACTVCGEVGHRADNARHRLDALPIPPTALPPPASQPEPVAEQPRPRRAPAPQAPTSRRSFLPVLPVVHDMPRAPLVGAAELAEVLAENEVDLGADDEDEVAGARAPAPAAPPAPKDSADGDEGGSVAAGDISDAAPKRLRWTPEPNDGAEEEVPALAALASGRWGRRHASIPADHRLRTEVRLPALAVLSDAEAEAILPRPVTRGDCANVPRPCPFVSCAHHLFLDANEDTGTIKLNHSTKEPWELAETCALDVADAGGATLEAVGELVGLTRERIRQVEVRALEKLRRGVPEDREADSPGPALRHPHGEVAA